MTAIAVRVTIRLCRAAGRWARVLTLAILGAIAFELILPISWTYFRLARVPYSP